MKTQKLFGVLAALAVGPLLTSIRAEPQRSGSEEVAMPEEKPVLVRHVPPRYPRELREQGVQGVAIVELEIDPRGRVVNTNLVDSTHPGLNSPALEAARHWVFTPAAAEDVRMTRRVQVPFHFVMPQVAAMERRR
jgi:periplasmic protein TonB